MTRRELLGAAAAASAISAHGAARPTVMLRSGWQSVNIGDVTHTPGVLAVFEKHMPEADYILWPVEIERGAEPMIARRFPKVKIVRGTIGKDGKPTTPELREAFAKTDLLVHGSAAGISGGPQFEAWHKLTGKPYGFFGVGVTLSGEAASAKLSPALHTLLDTASFVFTRETASLANLKKVGINKPVTGFAPDGTFSFDIRNDALGDAYLKANNLEPGKFIAVIPRLRYTPYHIIKKPSYGPEEAKRRDEYNAKYAESDHAKIREAVIAWVRKTGEKVLFCAEMTYQLDIIDALLYKPLPDDVKAKCVVRKSYWMPDEAASVYRKAVLVLSAECHSPIIAAANGTPCMYVHEPEDGIKGNMYPDIGLRDWFFEMDETTGAAIAARVLEVAANREGARRKVRAAAEFAQKKQAEAMKAVRAAVKL